MKIRKRIRDTDSVSVGVFIPAGSAFETEEERGLAHFIEHMLFKGTKRRTHKQIAEDIDRLGGMINAFTSKEYTCFYIRVLKDFIDDGFDVLRDMITNPLMDENELEKEKSVIIEEINMTEDTPEEAVFDIFMEKAVEGSLGKPILGTREHIRSYKKEDLLKFMGKYYRPESMILSCAGGVEGFNCLLDGEFYYTSFADGAGAYEPGFSFVPGVEVVNRDIQQSNVVLGCELFDIYDDRKYAAYLLNDIFGGTMSSRLFQSIRETKSLCYNISSSVRLFKKGGLFTIFAGTFKDNTQKLLDSIREELVRLKESGVTDEELNRAKTYFKGSYMLSLESSHSVMVKQGIDTIFYGDYVDEREVIDKIYAVNRDDLGEIIDLICDFDRYHVTVLGDVKDIKW